MLQLKAISSLTRLADKQTIARVVKRSDLKRWLAELMPVILILYDAQEDIAYWEYVQAYFERLPDFSLVRVGNTVTMRLPTAHRLDAASLRRFAAFRNAVHDQVRGVLRHHD